MNLIRRLFGREPEIDHSAGRMSGLPPAPHYERFGDQLLQGDIGYFPFAQLVRPEDSTVLPGSVLSDKKKIPAFEGMADTPIAIGGTRFLLRHWTGLGVVVDQTSELANSPLDSRVTVAALVQRTASGLNWELAAAGRYPGVLALPEADRGSIERNFPREDWPDAVVLPRSMATVSRRIVVEGRMMTLTPRMAALLAAKLSEFFGARHWARLGHFANVENRRLLQIDDVRKSQPPPTAGVWAVLHFENHEKLQVFLSPD